MKKKIPIIHCRICHKKLSKNAYYNKTTRCRLCFYKSRRGKNSNLYKTGISLKKYICPICGKKMWYKSKICRKCYIELSIMPNKSNSKEYRRLYRKLLLIKNPIYAKKQKELNKQYYQKNKEELKKYNKLWRKHNIKLILLHNKNRLLRLKGIKGSHTIEEWENLKKQFNYKCAICGITEKQIKIKWKNTNFDCLTKDHIIPISKNGRNDINNIRPVCISCNSEKKDKKAFKVIMTTGSWDLLHAGHLNIFLKAKELGDYLIVGVSTDALIKKYKHMNPIISYEDRKNLIENLRCVDKIVKQTKLVDIEQFKKLKADIFVLGTDWQNRYDNEGINWLRKHNKIIFLPYTSRLSSSKIKEKIIRNAIPIIQAQSKRK